MCDKNNNKIKISEQSTKKLPDYNHIDEALDDAYRKAHPLSSLRKPTTKETEDALHDGKVQHPKRAKMKHFSPILFVKLQVPHVRKDEQPRLE
jgi:hypothetical protein